MVKKKAKKMSSIDSDLILSDSDIGKKVYEIEEVQKNIHNIKELH